MLINEIMEKLQDIRNEYGNVEISARGYDEEWNETRYKIICGPMAYGHLSVDKDGYMLYEFSFSMDKI